MPHYIYNAEEIKRAVSLTRYFEDQGVPLFNGGRRAAAIWRDGTNPSVSIDADKGLWHDHVAGNGGTVIDAFVAIEGGTPLGAIRALGERYHVQPVAEVKQSQRRTRGDMLAADGYALVTSYTYTDEHGTPLYYVDRYEREVRDEHGRVVKVEKTFVQRSPTAENLNGVKRVLYNLPAVVKAKCVYIVEGEKDVETMRRMNLVATTNSGGGKFWQKDFNAYFENKDVVVIPDNDEVGKAHAEALVAQLLPLASSVKCVQVSRLPKGDVTDYIEKEGGTVASLIEMVEAAPYADAKENVEVTRAKELNAEPLRNWVWGEPVTRGSGTRQRTVTPKVPRPVDDICAEIRERFLRFPQRIGGLLFDFTRHSDPKMRQMLPLANKDELRAWVNATSGHQSEMELGGNFAAWTEIFARLTQTAKVYSGIARAPWYPNRDDVFPIYPLLPPADPTHSRFWEFVDRFCPSQPEDRILIAAFFLAPLFYDKYSPRPAWAIDTVDAQASGKTTIVKMCAALYGETPLGLDLKTLNNDITQVKKRILSTEGRAKRIALFDNLTESFKGANLADFITEPSITGMAPYGRGEETRANDITWVCTMNGGVVDTDMATRTYKIKIRKPTTYAPKWEPETFGIIEANRLQILADGLHLLANAPERVRKGSRFAAFDSVVLSAVCRDDEEFKAVSAIIAERANEANEDNDHAEELADIVVRYIAAWSEADTGIKPGHALVLRAPELNAILRSSYNTGALRNWTSKRIRRLIKEGNAPQFSRDFERITKGRMREVAGNARAVLFFPSESIPREGEVDAQLIQIVGGKPTAIVTEKI